MTQSSKTPWSFWSKTCQIAGTVLSRFRPTGGDSRKDPANLGFLWGENQFRSIKNPPFQCRVRITRLETKGPFLRLLLPWMSPHTNHFKPIIVLTIEERKKRKKKKDSAFGQWRFASLKISKSCFPIPLFSTQILTTFPTTPTNNPTYVGHFVSLHIIRSWPEHPPGRVLEMW